MNTRLNILPIAILMMIILSEAIYTQSNQPKENKFTIESSSFMSSYFQAENENMSIVGLLGSPFLKGGSSQNFRFVDDVFFAGHIVSASEDLLQIGIPEKYELLQNYPNPFNPSTTIKYSIPEEGYVNLTVYNIIGQNVAELVNEHLRAGYYEVTFNANNLGSGFYIYRITSEKFNSTKKMLLIK
jgi:hypothetical protein